MQRDTSNSTITKTPTATPLDQIIDLIIPFIYEISNTQSENFLTELLCYSCLVFHSEVCNMQWHSFASRGIMKIGNICNL